MNKHLKTIKYIVLFLLISPYGFLFAQIIDSFILQIRTDVLFFGLFLMTLFPCSSLALIMNIILRIIYKRKQIINSNLVSLEFVFAIFGILIGLMAWMFIFSL